MRTTLGAFCVASLLLASGSPTYTFAQKAANSTKDSKPHPERASLLRQAATEADKINDIAVKDKTLYWLAYALAEANLPKEAVDAATKIQNEKSYQIFALLRAARAYWEAGAKSDGANTVKKAIEISMVQRNGKPDFRYQIAQCLADHGQHGDALDYALSMPERQRHFAVWQTCKFIAATGDSAAALSAMRQNMDVKYHNRLTIHMAQSAAEAKQLDAALELSKQLGPVDRDTVLLALYRKFSPSEDAKAIQLVRAQAFDDTPFARLDQRRAAGTDVKKLMALAKTEKERSKKIGDYHVAFHTCIRENRPKQAEALLDLIAKTIEDDPKETQASKFGSVSDKTLIAIKRVDLILVAALYKDTSPADSERCRKAAVAAYQSIPQRAGLGILLSHSRLQNGLVALGHSDEAANLPGPRFSPPSPIQGDAFPLVMKGDYAAAREAIKKRRVEPSGSSRGRLVEIISDQLIEKRQLDEIKLFLESLGSTPEDYLAYAHVATTLTKAGEAKRVKTWLNDWPPAARAQTRIGIAKGLATADDAK